MQYRNFGRTGRTVSDIGFGAWAIGGSWGEVSESDARAALHAALDAGTTFIDTADVYGDGRSERIIADVLKERGGERPPSWQPRRGAACRRMWPMATMQPT